ncbi:hypothetical protein GCM10027258_92700 [Amycolatopsis stemonae]
MTHNDESDRITSDDASAAAALVINPPESSSDAPAALSPAELPLDRLVQAERAIDLLTQRVRKLERSLAGSGRRTD